MIREISLKGVARKYRNEGSSFNVIKDIFKKNNLNGANSLRDKLEDLAEDKRSFGYNECIYHGHAEFDQTWAHIEVRIELDPDNDVSDATINSLKPTWASGIQNTWNNQWALGRSGELSCDLTFDVRFVTSDRHHKVKVHVGPTRSNESNWDTQDTGAVVAHEFGHMLGNPDEYSDPNCPNRSPVNTGTIMDNNSTNIPSRLMQILADTIDSNVVAL
jgi:hypothetical protein